MMTKRGGISAPFRLWILEAIDMNEKLCSECGTKFFGRRHSRVCSLKCYFWSRYDKSAGPDACWIWRGYVSPTTGYGIINAAVAGKRTTAHRYAFRLAKGDPGPLNVLHRCDVRKCGNPAHLFAGTQLQNLQDAIAKGRPIAAAPGTANYRAKLDDELVRMIRSAPDSTKTLAELCGVNPSTIYNARRGITWRHVA